MTGLKNKSSLTREINEYLTDESKDKGLLLVLDVDHFKAVNDTYGHDIGDSVIIQIGHFLGKKYTSGEIVGRFGGDEFILFIKDTDDLEVASNIAKDITENIASNVLLPDDRIKLSISIGIAIYKGKAKNYSELFKKADNALYEAKGNSNTKFLIYDNN